MTDTPAALRMRLALDMYEFGERLQRSRLRRLSPEATEADIDAAVAAWLVSRPTAPYGDAAGGRSHRFG